MADATATGVVDIKIQSGNTEAEIKKLDNQIKTLDGAINLVGGSIETLAGGLALTGFVSEEQAKKFEGLAVGAIAFADGTKRTLDGVKNLKEGLADVGGVMGVVKKAQAALNATILANPYVAAAVAVAALAAALYLLSQRETEEEAANRKALETAKLRLENLEASETRTLAFARAQGIAAQTILEMEEASVKARIAEIDRILALEEDAEEYKRLSAEQQKLLDKEIELGLSLGNLKEQERQKEIKGEKDKADKLAAQRKTASEKSAADKKKEDDDKLKAEEDYLKMLDDLRKKYEAEDAKLQEEVTAATDAILQKRLDDQTQEENAVYDKYFRLQQAAEGNAEQLAILEEGLQQELTDIDKKYAKEREKTAAEEQKFKAQILTETIDNFQGALAALFGENKAVASANVLIDAAQAAVGIIASSQKFKDPTGTLAIAYQISQFALLAATTTASLRQINSAEPGSGGAPSTPKPSRIGGGAFTGALPGTGGGTFNAPTTGTPTGGRTEPIRAYVISQDVTTGQEANAAINRRRRLGG